MTAALTAKVVITNEGQQLELVALDAIWAARIVGGHRLRNAKGPPSSSEEDETEKRPSPQYPSRVGSQVLLRKQNWQR